jgi:hypothetical protein
MGEDGLSCYRIHDASGLLALSCFIAPEHICLLESRARYSPSRLPLSEHWTAAG